VQDEDRESVQDVAMLNRLAIASVILLIINSIIACNDIKEETVPNNEADVVYENDVELIFITRLDSPAIMVKEKGSSCLLLEWHENDRWMSNPPQSFINFHEQCYLAKHLCVDLFGESSHHIIAREYALSSTNEWQRWLIKYLDLWQTAPCVALDINPEGPVVRGYLQLRSATLSTDETRFSVKSTSYEKCTFVGDAAKTNLALALVSVESFGTFKIEVPGMDMSEYNYALIPGEMGCTQVDDLKGCKLFYIVNLNIVDM